MAIEVNQIKGPGERKPLFVLLVFLLVLVIFSGIYGYLFLKKKDINQKLENRESEIKLILNTRKEKEDKVNSDIKNISDFKKIFDNHKNVVRVFSIVENLSHPYVWFPSFNFQVESGTINLSGIARDFTSVGQQIMILKNIPGIKNVTVSGIQGIENGVAFNISFNIDTQILR